MTLHHTAAFRVDASSQMGSGHVMRCLTLADGLHAHGWRCRFVCRDHLGHLGEVIKARGFDVILLPAVESGAPVAAPAEKPLPEHASWLGCTWSQDAEETLLALKALKPDLLVVDHYGVDYRWEGKLKPLVSRLMVIDDLADRRHDCDVLLDQNWLGEVTTQRYKGLVPQTCIEMLGPTYALLKPEYAALRPFLPFRDGTVGRVLVFMGGSDPTNETTKVLLALSHPGLRHLFVDVIVGLNHPDKRGVQSQAELRGRVQVHENVPSLAALLVRADLMVGAGGATNWERLCLGVPGVLVAIANNQMAINQALQTEGCNVWSGTKEAVTADSLSDVLLSLLENEQVLQEIAAKSLEMVDGRGCSRVCDVLTSGINRRSVPHAERHSEAEESRFVVRRASEADAGMLFEWRNHPRTRQYFRNPAPLFKDQHIDWLKQTLLNESSLLLLVYQSDVPVGCVRFDGTGPEAEVSIYLDPSQHGRGLGKSVLMHAMNWLFAEKPAIHILKAEVHVDNVSSARMFMSCGYQGGWQTFEYQKTV